jgi:hypothetical protein
MELTLTDCPRSVPELKKLPRRERRRIWRRCYWRAFGHWQTWFGLAILGGGAAVSTFLGAMAGGLFKNGEVSWFTRIGLVVACGAGGGGVGGLFYGVIVNRITNYYVREHLQREGLVAGPRADSAPAPAP